MAQIREQSRSANVIKEWLESILSPRGPNQRRHPFASLRPCALNRVVFCDISRSSPNLEQLTNGERQISILNLRTYLASYELISPFYLPAIPRIDGSTLRAPPEPVQAPLPGEC